MVVPIEAPLGIPTLTKAVNPSSRSLLYRTKEVPRTAVSAEGIYVTLDDGSRCIDAVGGAAVCSIGNGNERVVNAVTEQMKKLAYVYNIHFTTQPAEELGEFLIDSSKGVFETVNFVAGGSEAVESAIKLARQYWWEIGQKQRVNFIGRKMSYHGNTLGCLAIGHHPTRRAPYAAIMNETSFSHVSPAYYKHYSHAGETEEDYSTRLAEELEAEILRVGADTVAAFFCEPMVGATQGCSGAPKGYWTKCRAVCDKYQVLFVFDEVMSGMWRMGTLFAYETLCEGVTPDLLTCAKGLGSGYVSIGAVFMNPRVSQAIRGGSGAWNSGFTYVGHPVACAGALEVQKIIKEEQLHRNIVPLGDRLRDRITLGLTGQSSLCKTIVSDIRGQGLFYGIEYTIPNFDQKTLSPRLAARIQDKCMEYGVVTLGMSGTIDGFEGDVLILAPMMVCSERDIDTIADVVIKASEDVWAAVQQEIKA